MRVFENHDDARRDLTAHRAVVTELYRLDGQARMLVRRVTEPRWSLSRLAPGRYELRVDLPADEHARSAPRSARFVRELAIQANTTAKADVVLSGEGTRWRRVALWVAAGTVVLAGALLETRHELQSMHLLGGLH